jgi:lipopolysaccharide transport system ATP-binding protein
MTDIAVDAAGIWKKFHRGELHDSLRDLVPAVAKRLMGRGPDRAALADGDFWAVEDVSFQVRRGEALGIIGPNGAGKSTTLKLLTQILRPNRGHCHVHGIVGALIEISAGFHPDLTGTENVYLQAAVMGMRRREVASKMDAIVDFAGIASFMDTPVKRYSSGMQARLGFSIAAHLEPDVLIIDEVLSVGDAAFQERCVHRMHEFKKSGAAIVFVSHNLQAVSMLCDSAILLNRSVRAYGPTTDVIAAHLKALPDSRPKVSGSSIELGASTLVGSDGEPVSVVTPGTPLRLRLEGRATAALSDLTVGFIVRRSTDGLIVYDGNLRGSTIGLGDVAAGAEFVVDVAFRSHLTRGQYHVECHVLHNPTQHFLARLAPAAFFTVQEDQTFAGVADLEVSAHATLGQGLISARG